MSGSSRSVSVITGLLLLLLSGLVAQRAFHPEPKGLTRFCSTLARLDLADRHLSHRMALARREGFDASRGLDEDIQQLEEGLSSLLDQGGGLAALEAAPVVMAWAEVRDRARRRLHAATEFAQALEERGVAVAAFRRHSALLDGADPELREVVSGLRDRLLLYAYTDEPAVYPRILASLAHLERWARVPAQGVYIDSLPDAARALVAGSERIDLLERRSSDEALAEPIERLRTLVNVHRSGLESSSRQYGIALAVLVAALLALLVYGLSAVRRASLRLRQRADFVLHNPNPIATLDRHGTLVARNEAMARCQARHSGCAVEFGRWLAGEGRSLVRRAADTGIPIRDCQTHIGERSWLISYIPVTGSGYVYAYFHDITEYRQGERLLAAQNSILTQLARNAPLEEILRSLCRLVDEQTAGMSSILLLQPDGRHLGQGVTARLPAGYAEALEGLEIGEIAGSCGTAAWRGESVFVTDTATDPLWVPHRDLASRFHIRACWSVPFRSSVGELLGTLASAHKEPRSPGPRDIEVMNNAATKAALAVEQHRSREALRINEQSLRELYGVASMRSTDYRERIRAVLEMGCRRFGLEVGVMARIDHNRYHVLAIAGQRADHQAGDDIPLDEGGMCHRVLQAGGPVAIADLDGAAAGVHPLYPEGALGAYFGCAVKVGIETYGVLDFSSSRPHEGTTFSPAEFDLMRLIAHWVGAELERRHIAQALSTEKERALITLESIGDGVITTDETGTINYLNPVAERMSEWTLSEAHGRSTREVLKLIHEDTREVLEDPVERCIGGREVVSLPQHTVLLGRGGGEVAIEDSVGPIQDHEGRVVGYVIVFHDVSQQRDLKQRLSFQASHDALTGLLNRREFERRLQDVLEDARAWDHVHALLYIDLDQFKIVNDTSGHMAGDELLRQLSRVLKEHVRETDTLARLGGDEFGMLLPNCALDKARSLAELLLERVRAFRFQWDQNQFRVGASIGVVAMDASSPGLSGVLSAADMACYAAKDAGRNRVYVYGLNDLEVARRRGEMLWVGRLRTALDEDLFELYAQPVTAMTASERTPPQRMELLLRLSNGSGEPLCPHHFLPAAERYGLMTAIDRWVIMHTLRYLSAACKAGEDQTVCSINLSAASLTDEGLFELIRDQLHEHGVPGRCLCIELTETAAIDNLPKALRLMEALKTEGCQFALDDFGKGFASYGHLKNLPVDFLKIDGEFIRDIASDNAGRAFVESIHYVAGVMGIETVAEWVEDETQYEILRQIGVHYAQGVFVGRPVPLSSAGSGAGS